VFQKLLGHFRALAERLMNLKDKPHSLAGGVAIGIFIGFTPLFGLKTLLCIGVAYALRCNPIAAVIAVSLHDVVTPFWPVLLEIEFKAGEQVLRWLGGGGLESMPTHLHIHDVMKWTTFLDLGLPMLIGSVFLAVPGALAAYFLTLPVFKRHAARHQEAEVREP
jgi:uncharacterized protein (DUF2062 family)